MHYVPAVINLRKLHGHAALKSKCLTVVPDPSRECFTVVLRSSRERLNVSSDQVVSASRSCCASVGEDVGASVGYEVGARVDVAGQRMRRR